MSLPINRLTQAELERLAILSEELGECQQIIGKIIRHGYGSYSPLDESKTANRKLLEKELGDVRFIMDLMFEKNDVIFSRVEQFSEEKRKKIKKYLHYN